MSTRAARWISRVSLSSLSLLAVVAAGCGMEGDHGPPPDPDANVSIPDCGIDAPIDSSATCASCTADQICVQFFDGTCRQFGIQCEPRNPACVGNACTPECMRWHCNQGNEQPFFRCDVGSCAGAIPGALTCYGP